MDYELWGTIHLLTYKIQDSMLKTQTQTRMHTHVHTHTFTHKRITEQFSSSGRIPEQLRWQGTKEIIVTYLYPTQQMSYQENDVTNTVAKFCVCFSLQDESVDRRPKESKEQWDRESALPLGCSERLLHTVQASKEQTMVNGARSSVPVTLLADN